MYFRYLTFSCPGQTKFIHSTKKKEEKIRRGDCKGVAVRGMWEIQKRVVSNTEWLSHWFIVTNVHHVPNYSDGHLGAYSNVFWLVNCSLDLWLVYDLPHTWLKMGEAPYRYIYQLTSTEPVTVLERNILPVIAETFVQQRRNWTCIVYSMLFRCSLELHVKEKLNINCRYKVLLLHQCQKCLGFSNKLHFPVPYVIFPVEQYLKKISAAAEHLSQPNTWPNEVTTAKV